MILLIHHLATLIIDYIYLVIIILILLFYSYLYLINENPQLIPLCVAIHISNV